MINRYEEEAMRRAEADAAAAYDDAADFASLCESLGFGGEAPDPAEVASRVEIDAWHEVMGIPHEELEPDYDDDEGDR